MSNEELVAQIQAGATEYMEQLWNQIDGLVKQQTNKVVCGLALRGNSCGVEFDDLYQTGYLALIEAVKTYKPDGMSFAAWLVYYLKTAFAEVTGYRTAAGRKEPLNNALSLEKPVGEEADGPDRTLLGDCIEDPRAAAALTGTVDEVWRKQLSEALSEALSDLPVLQADTLRLRYFDELSLEETRHKLGVSRDKVTQAERRGLRKLKTDKLRQFYEFDYYGGTGLTAFRNSGRSVQERYLIELERKSRKPQESRKEAMRY